MVSGLGNFFRALAISDIRGGASLDFFLFIRLNVISYHLMLQIFWKLSSVQDDDEEEEDELTDYEFKKWCGVRRSTVLFVFYLVSYLAYLFIGGYVMAILETSHEEDLKQRTRMVKEKFLESYPQINSRFLVIDIITIGYASAILVQLEYVRHWKML